MSASVGEQIGNSTADAVAQAGFQGVKAVVAMAPADVERRVQYVKKNPKRPGSACHGRYEKYKKAKTLREAMDLGAGSGDVKWDKDAGFLTFPGQKVSDSALKLSIRGSAASSKVVCKGFGASSRLVREKQSARPKKKVRAAGTYKQGSDALPTHLYLEPTGLYKAEYSFSHLSISVIRVKTLDLAKRHLQAMKSVRDLVQKHLRKLIVDGKAGAREDFVKAMKDSLVEMRISWPQLSEWQYHTVICMPDVKNLRCPVNACVDAAMKGWSELHKQQGMNDISGFTSLDERRQDADAFAADALKELGEDRCPSDETLLTALRLWGFDKSKSRPNVTPDGQDWVHSDTVGLIESWNDHKIYISRATKMNFLGLLARFVNKRSSNRIGAKMPFTTIAVNKGYGAKLHRDRNNVGPSVGWAVGSWKGGGGGLRYWPDDGKIGDVEKVRGQQSIVLNVRKEPAVFDGTCGHEVEPFKGERFSLVFFSIRGFEKTSKAIRKKMEAVGCEFPSHASLQRVLKHAPKNAAKRGR